MAETQVFDNAVGTSPVPGAQALFNALAESWHIERGVTSSVTEMSMCRSYQRIVGMGQGAVPLILARLADEGEEPDHWFWALKAITGADPVPENARGDVVRMAQAWLQWGQANGYASSTKNDAR
jgi:hypothetical protein